MAYTRPTISTIISRVLGDISGRTEGSAFLEFAPERIMGLVQAGIAHGVYGMLEWVTKQLLPTTCELEGLLRWGVMLKLPRNPATQAVRTATFAGTNGTPLPIGTALRSPDDALWTVTVGGTVAGGSVTVTAKADAAGKAGNLAVSVPISLLNPIAGINTDGAIASVVTDGVDIEGVEEYRLRILDNLRVPPSGGGPGDYVAWAKEVSGVTRAWEFGNRMGYGTVSLAFVRDNDGGSIIPDAGEVSAVFNYVDAKRPIDLRQLFVEAPIAQPVDMTIALVPNTVPVQAAVTASLQELFKREAQLEGTLALSNIDEAISSADGETSHSINSIGSLVTGDGSWKLLTLGTITFV
jgi:uncharacterized phage protein gp47/JayE